ncbi:type ISP restriction/modification enzyme [Acetobacter aceti]|uniref:type ISP restriction/modification enzyme n=1 Tax=Acetobacter aceti TaxID=435 RepID=UPI00269B16B7
MGINTMSINKSNHGGNLVICVTGMGGCRSEFGVLMVGQVPDLHISPDATQSFPLYVYSMENKDER